MKVLNLSLKKSKLTAKNRNANGYNSMPKDKLLKIIKDNNEHKESLFK